MPARMWTSKWNTMAGKRTKSSGKKFLICSNKTAFWDRTATMKAWKKMDSMMLNKKTRIETKIKIWNKTKTWIKMARVQVT